METALSTPLTSGATAPLLFPTLTVEQIARIASHGVIRPITRGEVLIMTRQDLAAARWPLERSPYLLETSRPGVFAVGDVRCGNVKRVASAVGEGSIAISFVHRVLAESLPVS